MKIFLALIVILASLSLQAQTNIIYPTSVITGTQTVHCGIKKPLPPGYNYYTNRIGNYWGYYPTGSNNLTATGNSNDCVQFFGAFGDNGEAKGHVAIPKPAFSPAYQFITYPTNTVGLGTNHSITLTGFNP